MALTYGRLPSSSFLPWPWSASSRALLRASKSLRYSDSSLRKLRMRSFAFSCFAGLSSCFARELYSSIVRWKAVREALREPRAAGLMIAAGEDSVWGCEERLARSLRMEVLCLRAVLKVVFCWATVSVSQVTVRRPCQGTDGNGRREAYHDGRQCSATGSKDWGENAGVSTI